LRNRHSPEAGKHLPLNSRLASLRPVEINPVVSPANFATTRWSMVVAARGNDSTESHAALSWLCERYWFPLYAFARSRGGQPADTQDLVQGFFEHVLATPFFDAVQAGRCQFRAFLLASFQNWAASEWTRQNRQKRGGGLPHVSMDQDAEMRFQLECSDHRSPEYHYDRAWALTLLERVFSALRAECDGGDRSGRFDMLKAYLVGDRGELPLEPVAEKLSIPVSSLRVTLHRLRVRFRELLTSEIRQTVERESDVRAELGYLFAALGR
jgi:DNA-directed RNA polymerase specialized sigma24 family protein